MSDEHLRSALMAIRKAAAGATTFTRRLEFIYERAGVALADEPWSEDHKTEFGYHTRNRNQAIFAALTAERERSARLEAALQRSLNWLASYPGEGALGAYDQARTALEASPVPMPTGDAEQIE